MKIRQLSTELAEKARLELNEDPKRVEDDVQHIKNWIAKQPHLRARTDEQWILGFLRGCKFSLERTKEKFDLYYTLRSTAPELWRYKYNDPKVLEILNLGVVLILPKSIDKISPRVALVRIGAYDPNKYHITDIMSASNIVQEIMMQEDDILMVSGATTILDLEGVSTGHLMQMTPASIKKMVVMGQDATPVRMKGHHYLNTPATFETLFNFMKTLLNEKNKNRMYVHNKNYEEMYKHIPQEVLPAEYGGKGGAMQEIIDHWKNKVQEYQQWLKEGQNCGTDESKRPGKPKTAEELFGVEGSFRQLQFD